MANENKALIEQPQGMGEPKGIEPVIQVMPAKYRGMALHETPVRRSDQQAEPKPRPVPSPEPKPPVAKPPEPPKSSKPAKKKGFPVKLVVIGIVVIALFAAAAIVILSTLQQPEPTVDVVVPDDTITPDDLVVVDDAPIEDDTTVVDDTPIEDDTTNPFAEDLVPGIDSDSDGLTNVEELLYGTNVQLPDSDEDGFLDGNEVFHRYNPNGTAPASLLESGLVRLFDEASFSYTVNYPSLWNVRAIGGPTEQVIFTAESGEVVQVLLNSKTAETSISDWFLSQDLQASVDDLLTITTKEGLTGIMSPDRLTAYLDAGERVYIISYNVGNKLTVDYLQTFQMMLNSMMIR